MQAAVRWHYAGFHIKTVTKTRYQYQQQSDNYTLIITVDNVVNRVTTDVKSQHGTKLLQIIYTMQHIYNPNSKLHFNNA